MAKRRREGYAERRERLGAVDDPALVLEAALRFLEPRRRSIGEVRRRLTGAGYRAGLVESAIERLTGLGILDDAEFARAWVESRDRARPRGERALRRELQVKGVERTTVDEAMEERHTEPGGAEDPDSAAAEALITRHAAALRRVADLRKRRQRAYALLARNGFDPETASAVSRRFMDASSADDESGAELDPAPDPALG
ncbi:MAG TPA: regulatory protein RecX [Candidatus Limnocylindrales bacterium]